MQRLAFSFPKFLSWCRMYLSIFARLRDYWAFHFTEPGLRGSDTLMRDNNGQMILLAPPCQAIQIEIEPHFSHVCLCDCHPFSVKVSCLNSSQFIYFIAILSVNDIRFRPQSCFICDRGNRRIIHFHSKKRAQEMVGSIRSRWPEICESQDCPTSPTIRDQVHYGVIQALPHFWCPQTSIFIFGDLN